MTNTSDNTEKVSSSSDNMKENTSSPRDQEPVVMIPDEDEAQEFSNVAASVDEAIPLVSEKAEGPASEVVEFQDAAKSMSNMTSDVVTSEVMFVEDESSAELQPPGLENRTVQPVGRRSRYQNGRLRSAPDLLLEHILEKAHRAHPALRAELCGTIIISLDEGRQRYLVDWRNDPLKVAEAKEATADCVIHVKEEDLELIAQGNLNPQIAMLSDKIRIEGSPTFAMYFFNLIAPTSIH